MSLATAIVSKWRTSSLSADLPGGFWKDEIPTNSAWPFQVFLILAEVFDGQTTHNQHRLASFEIHTFYKAIDGEDPQTRIEEIVDATDTVFDEAILNVDDRSVYKVTQSNRRTFKDDSDVYRGLNEFTVKLRKGR